MLIKNQAIALLEIHERKGVKQRAWSRTSGRDVGGENGGKWARRPQRVGDQVGSGDEEDDLQESIDKLACLSKLVLQFKRSVGFSQYRTAGFDYGETTLAE